MIRNSISVASVLAVGVATMSIAASAASSDAAAPQRAADHEISFGAAKFTKELWLNKGELITNPRAIDVESVNAGAFALEIVDEAGTVKVHNKTKNEHGGWTSWDFPSLGIYGGKYKLRFVNEAAGTREIK